MKRLLLSIVLFGALSCSSDESKRSSTYEIIGKWHLIQILENGKEVTGYSCNAEYNINEYMSDGVSIIKFADTDSKNICKQYTETGTYLLEDDVLTETQTNGSVVVFVAKYKIKEITSTSLKLEAISLFEANSDGSSSHTSNYTEGEEIKVYNHIN